MNSVKKGKDPTQGHKKVVLPEDRPGVQDKDANRLLKKESKKPKSKKSSKGGLFGFGKPKRTGGPKRAGGPRKASANKGRRPKEIMENDLSDTTMLDPKEVNSALSTTSEQEPISSEDLVVKSDSNNDTESEDNVKEEVVKTAPKIKREVTSLASPNSDTSDNGNLVVELIRGTLIDSEQQRDVFINMLLNSAKSLSVVPLALGVNPTTDYLDLIFDIEDNKEYLKVEDVIGDTKEEEEEVYAEPSIVETRKISTEDRQAVRTKASSFQKDSINKEVKREQTLSDRREKPRARTRQRKRSLEDLLV